MPTSIYTYFFPSCSSPALARSSGVMQGWKDTEAGPHLEAALCYTSSRWRFVAEVSATC
jgi:hypothetical protein